MCVLLVEDEPLISTIMTECLTDAGYDVIQATDGDQAFRLIAEPPLSFTVLVTDVHLSGGPNGLAVAGHVRRLFPHLPVIVATGRPDALNDVSLEQLNYCLLRKPYRPSELIGAIEAAIGPGPHGPGGGHARTATP